MEFQFSKSRQPTLMEKIFQHCDDLLRDGVISIKHLSILLQNLQPELNIDDEELQKIIAQHDRNGSGQLDFESVIKIIYNFVAKQSSTEYLDEYFIQSENSSNKNRLSIYDFIIFNNL